MTRPTMRRYRNTSPRSSERGALAPGATAHPACPRRTRPCAAEQRAQQASAQRAVPACAELVELEGSYGSARTWVAAELQQGCG